MNKILDQIAGCRPCMERYSSEVYQRACASISTSYAITAERLIRADLIFYHQRDHTRPRQLRTTPQQIAADLANDDLAALDD